MDITGKTIDSYSDLAEALGGSPDSYIGRLLLILPKADPENLARLSAMYPRLIAGWRRWMAGPHPMTTTELGAYLDSLGHEEMEASWLFERLASLLTQTANALKGDPDPLVWHDWSDLPEIARAVAGLPDEWQATAQARQERVDGTSAGNRLAGEVTALLDNAKHLREVLGGGR
jgi:hypothetical protein